MIKLLILSFLQFFALSMTFDKDAVFKPFSILEIPLFIFIFILTRFIINKNKNKKIKHTISVLLLGSLFSLFMYMGHSLDKQGDLSEMVFTGNYLFKTLTLLVGYAIFFFFCIQFLFLNFEAVHIVDQNDNKELRSPSDSSKKHLRFFDQKPFLCSFIILTILTMPNIIISYPGICMGDTYYQLSQAYRLPYTTPMMGLAPQSGPLYKTVDGEKTLVKTNISNIYPVAHTLLLEGCMKIGSKLFHSDNAGLFILVLIQNLIMNLLLAFTVKLLREHFHIKPIILACFLAYYILHPAIFNTMVTISKEAIYIPFLIVLITELAIIIQDDHVSMIHSFVILAMGALGVFLFRNEGKLLMMVTFLILAVCVPNRRLFFLSFIALITVSYVFFERILLPSQNIAPGHVQEILTIPFQQTARYVRDAGDTVTEEEKKMIGKILDYDKLADNYNPNISDRIKRSYSDTATSSDLKRYLITWVKMFFKRPDIYLLASMNNYYQYVYPYSSKPQYNSYHGAEGHMGNINWNLEVINMHLFFPPEFDNLRNSYENTWYWLSTLPLIRGIWVTAYYIWASILYTAYCIYKHNKKALLIAVPMLIQIIMFFMGPTNGYYPRYIFILKACLPVIFLTGFTCIENNSCVLQRENSLVK